MNELNEENILCVIKNKTNFNLEYAKQTTETDKEFSLRHGVKTAVIATELRITTARARRILESLKDRGLLYSHKGPVTYTWWPIGYLDEFKS